MKQSFLLFILGVSIVFQSCKNDFDDKGRLPLKNLITASGALSLSPMSISDSASRLAYTPDTFFYKNKPYTGPTVRYEYDTIATIIGNFKEGLMDGEWAFYFTSGGVKMKGNMKNGMAVGSWKSYYGYDKVSIEKDFDEQGFLMARKEFYDNGKVKNEQNLNCPKYGRERLIAYDKSGKVTSIYVKDSIK